MNNIQYPTNVHEFLDSKWFPKVMTAIKGFHLREEPLDTMQDILVALLEKGYLERWDSSKGSYSGWLYVFVNNILRCKYNRSMTKGGRAIEGAASLERPIKEEGGEVLACLITDKRIFQSDIYIMVEEIQKVLSDPEFAAHSSYNNPNGTIYPRDMRTVFDLLILQHNSIKDIAVKLHTSPQFIYSLVRKMRPLVKQVFGLESD